MGNVSRAGYGRNRWARLTPIAVGVAALWAGLWAGLMRLGWPTTSPGIAVNHGPLIVGGFIGTVIALERAVALGRPWGYAAPWLGALGAVSLLLPAPPLAAAVALTLSSLVLLAIFRTFLNTQWTDFTFTMAMGALCWAIGNALWLLGRPVPDVVPLWAGFLVLTIAGERFEMSRFRPRPPAAQRAFWLLAGGYLAALAVGVALPDVGVRAGGVLLIGITLWLVRFDVARWTVKRSGLPKYSAFAVLSGYFWLALAGLLATLWGHTWAGFRYDAWIHAQFLGFALMMIMAHAPIILPAVARLPIDFTPAFYVPVLLLHASLAVRIAADLTTWWPGRLWSGTTNVAAVVLFLLVVAGSAVRARNRQPKGTPAGPPPSSGRRR